MARIKYNATPGEFTYHAWLEANAARYLTLSQDNTRNRYKFWRRFERNLKDSGLGINVHIAQRQVVDLARLTLYAAKP